MDPTNTPARIKLKGTNLALVFDLNTFAAFEEATGTMFLTWMDGIQKATLEALRLRSKTRMSEFVTENETESEPDDKKAQELLANAEATGALLRTVSMRDFRALVWAANHTYDRAGVPRWPLTINQIGSLIDLTNFSRVMPEVLRGSLNAIPTSNEGEEEKAETENGPFGRPKPVKNEGNGGTTSPESDADILGLLTPNSAA